MAQPDRYAAQVGQQGINRRTFLRGATAAAGSAAMGSLPAFAANPVEILVLHVWGTPPGQAAASTMHPIAQLIEAFNARNTGIVVRGETPSTDYFATLQKAQAQIAAGRAPALVTTPWSNINFAVQGLQVAPLEKIGGNEVRASPRQLQGRSAAARHDEQADGRPAAGLLVPRDVLQQRHHEAGGGRSGRAVQGLGLVQAARPEGQGRHRQSDPRPRQQRRLGSPEHHPVQWRPRARRQPQAGLGQPAGGGGDGRPSPTSTRPASISSRRRRKATLRSSAARWRSGWRASPRWAVFPSR